MLLRCMLLRWLLFVWLLLGWLLLGWLLLGWLLLIFNLNKTPLGQTGCLSNPYFLLTGCLGIQFSDSPYFSTQSVRLPLFTYPSLCSTCVTHRTPCHAMCWQVLPTQPLPREAEDFPRTDKVRSAVGSIYMRKPPHRTLISPSLILHQHFKSLIC